MAWELQFEFTTDAFNFNSNKLFHRLNLSILNEIIHQFNFAISTQKFSIMIFLTFSIVFILFLKLQIVPLLFRIIKCSEKFSLIQLPVQKSSYSTTHTTLFNYPYNPYNSSDSKQSFREFKKLINPKFTKFKIFRKFQNVAE